MQILQPKFPSFFSIPRKTLAIHYSYFTYTYTSRINVTELYNLRIHVKFLLDSAKAVKSTDPFSLPSPTPIRILAKRKAERTSKSTGN